MPRDLLEINNNSQLNAAQNGVPRDLLENYTEPAAAPVSQIPPSETGIGSYIPTSIKNIGLGLAQGIANTPADIWDLLARAQKATARPGSLGELYPMESSPVRPPRYDIAPHTFGSEVAQVAGGTLIPGMVAEKSLPTVAKMLPKAMGYIAEKTPAIATGIESAIPSAIASGSVAAGNKDSNIPLNMAVGGIGGGTIGATMSKLMPALLTSNLSPLNIIKQVRPHVEDLVNKVKGTLLGGADENNIPNMLFNKAKTFFELQRGNISSKYDTFLKQAENSGATYDTGKIKDTISSLVKDYAEDLNSMDKNNPTYGQLTSDLQHVLSYMPRTATDQGVIDTKTSLPKVLELKSSGKQPITKKLTKDDTSNAGQLLSTFTDAERAKRLLTNDITDAFRSDNTRLGASLRKIKDSVHSAINDSVKSSPVLSGSLKDIDTEYAKLMQTYIGSDGKETPFGKLYYAKNPNTDLFMSNYVRPGIQGDRSSAVGNLFNMLPDDESRKLVAAWWLKDAKNPLDVIKKYGKLGVNQQQILFGENAPAMQTLDMLYKKHPSVFKQPPEIDKPIGIAGQAAASATAFLSGHPMYGALLGARPVGQTIAPLLATPEKISQFMNLGLEPGKDLGAISKEVAAVAPALWSKFRRY